MEREYRELLTLTRTLCAKFGPSGWEDAVREYILQAAMPYADGMETDPMGNLMVLRRGRRPAAAGPIMLCAHMDEVGVIVKSFTEDGMVKFGFVGGVDPRVVIGRRIQFRTEDSDTVEGIVGRPPDHGRRAAARAQDKGPLYRYRLHEQEAGRGQAVAGRLRHVCARDRLVWRRPD